MVKASYMSITVLLRVHSRTNHSPLTVQCTVFNLLTVLSNGSLMYQQLFDAVHVRLLRHVKLDCGALFGMQALIPEARTCMSCVMFIPVLVIKVCVCVCAYVCVVLVLVPVYV